MTSPINSRARPCSGASLPGEGKIEAVQEGWLEDLEIAFASEPRRGSGREYTANVCACGSCCRPRGVQQKGLLLVALYRAAPVLT